MGLKCLSVSVVLLSVAVYFVYIQLLAPKTPPILSITQNWGPSKPTTKIPTGINSFKINYSAAVIEELRKKLSEPLRLQKPLEGVGFRYGFQKNTLEEFVTFWRDDYLKRWDQRQAFLNQFPQFTTEVQGLNIHYIHAKGTSKKTLPLLLLHGWPGSVREFYELIPKLNTPFYEDVSFEVIAPSLPGYGWSDGASIPGLGAAEAAVVLRNLMLKLGYERFVVQGGDWGAIIGSHLTTLFPENVIGYHSNMCGTFAPIAQLKGFVASFYPSLFIKEEHTDFVFPAGEKFLFIIEEMGYFHLQATKPDTIGAALSYNPVGLAAYILEKFSTWTNPKYRSLDDGGLKKDFAKDALIDNLMIYYLSNSITTSVRLYAESLSPAQFGLNLDRVPVSPKVPIGCARFKHDPLHSTDWQLVDKFPNLVHSTFHTDGGHFIALQKPDVLYEDFVEYAKKVLAKTLH